jgi:uncharacterized protein DUF4136
MRNVNMAGGLALVLAAALAAAHPARAQDVSVQMDNGAPFSTYKTYTWVNIAGVQYPEQLTDMNIRNAIDSILKLKGMIKVDSNPSVNVAYQMSVTQSQQINMYGTGMRWGGGMATASTSTINNGDLVIDFYDPNLKLLVWRGQGTKAMNPSSNPQKNQENLLKAVDKILKGFPPKPGS